MVKFSCGSSQYSHIAIPAIIFLAFSSQVLSYTLFIQSDWSTSKLDKVVFTLWLHSWSCLHLSPPSSFSFPGGAINENNTSLYIVQSRINALRPYTSFRVE